jgi:hypothetical protein
MEKCEGAGETDTNVSFVDVAISDYSFLSPTNRSKAGPEGAEFGLPLPFNDLRKLTLAALESPPWFLFFFLNRPCSDVSPTRSMFMNLIRVCLSWLHPNLQIQSIKPIQ